LRETEESAPLLSHVHDSESGEASSSRNSQRFSTHPAFEYPVNGSIYLWRRFGCRLVWVPDRRDQMDTKVSNLVISVVL
jgi:hypothetical protein